MDIKKVVVGEWGVNCYLIVSGNTLAVIDPGDGSERIISEIEKLGKVNCKYILLTHGHFDHVGAVNELKEKYGFDIVIGEKDKDISGMNMKIGVQVPEIKQDVTVEDGQTLKLDSQTIEVFETPGHTKGSVSYLIGENLFSGDTLFHHTHGRTDLPGGSDEEMKRSLEKLLRLDENIKVYPGHGEETTIEEERRYSDKKRY